MTSLIEYLESHPVTAGLLVSALSLIVPAVRRHVTRFLKAWLVPPSRVLEEMKGQGERLQNVEKQLLPNGGSSIADGIARLEAGQIRLEGHRRHEFIMQPKPVLELNSRGNALLVSAAFGRLVRADPGGLRGMSYLQYFDGDRVDDFRTAFHEVADNEMPSDFGGFILRIYANNDRGPKEDRGMWEIRGVPIAARKLGDTLYSVTFHPADDVARAIADRNRWTV